MDLLPTRSASWLLRVQNMATITHVHFLWLPSGKLTQLWKITIFNGKIHYKWPFSIAMLNYQRVSFHDRIMEQLCFFQFLRIFGNQQLSSSISVSVLTSPVKQRFQWRIAKPHRYPCRHISRIRPCKSGTSAGSIFMADGIPRIPSPHEIRFFGVLKKGWLIIKSCDVSYYVSFILMQTYIYGIFPVVCGKNFGYMWAVHV